MSEVGKLWVSVGLNSRGLEAGLSATQARLRTASQQLGTFGRSMTRYVTLPILAAGAGILALAVKTGNFADELLDLSAATGISTDSLQRFRYMSSAAGTETDAVADSILYMTRQMTDLDTYSKRVTETAEAYNVELRDMHDNVRAAEDVHWDLMLAIAAIEDPQERAAAGAQAFGRQWERIAPIVDLGVEALERFEEQEVISREKLEAANKFREAWDGITHTLGIIAMEVGIELIEMLDELFDMSPENLRKELGKLRDTVLGVVERIQEWIEWWQQLEPEMQEFYIKAAALVIILGPASSGLAGVLNLVSAGLRLLAGAGAGSFAAASGAAGAAAAPGAGLAVLLGKLGLILVAVLAIIDAWRRLKRLQDSVGTDGIMPGWNQGDSLGGSFNLGDVKQQTHDPRLDFDTGGVVPGPLGKPQLAVVHSGETVLPTHKTGQADSMPELNGRLAMLIVDDRVLKQLHGQLKGVELSELARRAI